MNLVVDTSVWSLLLRRKEPEEDHPLLRLLTTSLNSEHTIHLLGPILQEILDGIQSPRHFKMVQEYFLPFPLARLDREDYVQASHLRNHCRTAGITAGPMDFLIASFCIQRRYPLLTADKDFSRIARHSPLELLS